MIILLARGGGLGDTVLIWPDLCQIRSQFPDSEIHLLGPAHIMGLFCHLPGVRLADPDPDPSRFDLAAWYGSRPRPGWLWVDSSRCPVAGPCPPLPVAGDLVRRGLATITGAGLDPGRLALLAPGTSGHDKRLAASRWAGIVARLQARRVSVGLLWGPQDAYVCRGVVKACDRPPPVIKTACPDLAGVLACAGLVVAPDSGVGHLASIVGVRTVSLWAGGRYPPEVWAPVGACNFIMDRPSQKIPTTQ